ncbi:hypothetical protein H072_1818 [Dactylellina haptotyla CBS 200.50]|uniref:F-box domain-containing protein n=1 Tax=Dactylellina haptotyla (strain CBS 200.50) TaxID=1284197 RepID=S8BXB7_DACHA|nr:hypothetical protein H072_1818 [Dactylellina haptotyla CBS 200.50]
MSNTHANPTTTGILSLPVELQTEILSYLLPWLSDVVPASKTCRLWHSIISSRSFCEARYYSPEDREYNDNRTRCIIPYTHKILDPWGPDIFSRLGITFQNGVITEYRYYSADTEIPRDGSKSIESPKCLPSVDITDCPVLDEPLFSPVFVKSLENMTPAQKRKTRKKRAKNKSYLSEGFVSGLSFIDLGYHSMRTGRPTHWELPWRGKDANASITIREFAESLVKGAQKDLEIWDINTKEPQEAMFRQAVGLREEVIILELAVFVKQPNRYLWDTMDDYNNDDWPVDAVNFNWYTFRRELEEQNRRRRMLSER